MRVVQKLAKKIRRVQKQRKIHKTEQGQKEYQRQASGCILSHLSVLTVSGYQSSRSRPCPLTPPGAMANVVLFWGAGEC